MKCDSDRTKTKSTIVGMLCKQAQDKPMHVKCDHYILKGECYCVFIVLYSQVYVDVPRRDKDDVLINTIPSLLPY